MTEFRPADWPKSPCDSCERKLEDDYGYVCDLACGKHSNWLCFETGASLMLKMVRKQQVLVLPPGISLPGGMRGKYRFIPDETEERNENCN